MPISNGRSKRYNPNTIAFNPIFRSKLYAPFKGHSIKNTKIISVDYTFVNLIKISMQKQINDIIKGIK